MIWQPINAHLISKLNNLEWDFEYDYGHEEYFKEQNRKHETSMAVSVLRESSKRCNNTASRLGDSVNDILVKFESMMNISAISHFEDDKLYDSVKDSFLISL